MSDVFGAAATRLKSELQQGADVRPPTENDLASAARRVRQEQDAARLRESATAAQGSNPDTAARALRLGQETGLPPAVVERNMPEVERQAELSRIEGVSYDEYMANYFANAENYRIARDDIDTLGGISKALRFTGNIARAVPGGAVGGAGSAVSGAGSFYDALTRNYVGRPIDAAMGALGLGSLQDYNREVPWWMVPSEIFRRGGGAIKEIGRAIDPPVAEQNIATDIAGGVGQLGFQIAAAIVSGGTVTLPMLLAQGADQQAERLERQGKYGTAQGDAAIIAGSAVTGLTEKLGLDFIMRKLPQAARDGIMRRLQDVAVSAGAEAAQEVIEGILQNVVEYAFYNPDAEIFQDFSREAIAAGGAAAIVRSILLAASGGRASARRREDGERAVQESEALKQVNALAEESKLRERNPDKFREFVRGLVEPDRSVEIDAETAVTLFQSEPDLTQFLSPEEAERVAGEVALAREIGSDVRMPLGTFVSAFVGHPQFDTLAENVRLTEDGPTAREASMTPERLEREVGLLREEVGTVARQQEATRQIYDDIFAKLKAAGQDDLSSTKYAAIFTARLRTRAERLGRDALELYAENAPIIQRQFQGPRIRLARLGVPAEPEYVSKVMPSGLKRTLEDARKGVKLRTRSMTSFLVSLGGMRDDGGELKAIMGSYRAMPGLVNNQTRRRTPDGRGWMGGMALDMAHIAAIEEGYMSEDSTLDEFLEVLSDDVNKRVINYGANEDFEGQERQSAAQELERELEALGMSVRDPDDKIAQALGIDPEMATATLEDLEALDRMRFRGAEAPALGPAEDPNTRTLDQGAIPDPRETLRQYSGGTSVTQDGFLDLSDQADDLLDAVRDAQSTSMAEKVADDWVVARGKKTNLEHLVAFDRDGGLIAVGRGEKHRVSFPRTILKAGFDKAIGYATHNHPGNGGFSVADLGASIEYGTDITAMGHGGAIVSGRAGPTLMGKDLPIGFAGNVTAEVEAPVRAYIQGLVNEGRISVNQAIMAHSHVVDIFRHRYGLIDLRSNGLQFITNAGFDIEAIIRAVDERVADVLVRNKLNVPAVRDFAGDQAPGGSFRPEPGRGRAVGVPQGNSAGARRSGRNLPGTDPRQLALLEGGDGRILNQPVWHGSPHVFDRFSLSKIGTGEGAQAFGWGLYFASSEAVARSYRDALSTRTPLYKGKPLGEVDIADELQFAIISNIMNYGDDPFSAADRFFKNMPSQELLEMGVTPYSWAEVRAARDAVSKDFSFDKSDGRLYKVDIPEDNEYLLWDRPLSEQPEGVREKIKGLLRSDLTEDDKALYELLDGLSADFDEAVDFAMEQTGQVFYRQLSARLKGDKAASLALHDAGIPGLKYLDGSTRATADGEILGVENRDGQWFARIKKYGNALIAGAPTDIITKSKGYKTEEEARAWAEGQIKAGSFNYVLFDENRVAIMEFFQRQETGPRGSIQFLPNGQTIINLTEKADLSTFLHEMSHGWLEEMKADAQSPGAPAQIVEDWQRIAAYLGIDPGVDFIPTEAHETFARTGEAYFMEGKAPSLELSGAFERFKAWMVRIYRTLTELRVPINDEIRGVFDRMLATDDEIEAAKNQFKFQGLFALAKDAGMTDAEFRKYQDLAAKARLQAEQQVLAMLQADERKAQREEYREAREGITAEVEAQVRSEPVYQAITMLAKGEMPDGTTLDTPMKLDRAMLREAYGRRIANVLPRGVTGDKGVSPDLVAPMFGFTSGDEMIQAMRAAPSQAREVQRRVQERLKEQFPNPVDDGRAAEEAIAALHNDAQMQVLEAEFKALQRLGAGKLVDAAVRRSAGQGEQAADATGPEARAEAAMGAQRRASEARLGREKVRVAVDSLRADRKAIERAADAVIGETKVNDLLNTQKWRRAERASANAVIDAVAGRDWPAAAWHQRQRIINAHMVRRSMEARKDIEKAIARFDKYMSRKPGPIDPDYLDKVRTILGAYQFGPQLSDRRRTLLEMKALLSWRDALAEDEQARLDIPAEITAADEKTHYRDMTVSEFMTLRDTVENIATVGRTKNRLLRDAAERDLNRTATLVSDAILANVKTVARRSRESIEKGVTYGMTQFKDQFFASHRKIESLVREFDGFQNLGPVWRALFKPLQDAQNLETRMSIDAAEAIRKLFEQYPKDARRTWRTKTTYYPEIGQSLSKATVMSLALNWGNEGNREAIRKGFKWSDDQVRAVLNQTLTESDWQFVQATWDYIDSFWPQLAALEKRVKGIEPVKVEASPVRTPFGELRGGYYPLKYDPDLSERAFSFQVDKMAQNLMSGAVAKASTRAGAALERVGSGGMPVRLELDVMFEHVAELIHDISHRESILDVMRLIEHPEVKGAVLETKGPQFHRAMKDWVRDVAAGDVPALTWFDKVVQHLRGGMSIAAMGWKLTTALVQVTGFLQSAAMVPKGQLLKSVAGFYSNPLTMSRKVDFVFERSVEMRTRSKSLDRDIRDALRKLGPEGKRDAVKRSFFYLTGLMDMGVAVPTWLASYEVGMDEFQGDEAKAIEYADQVVRTTQSSGLQKDLASIQRGDPRMKMFTAFYSYFSATYNLMVEQGRGFRGAKDMPRFVANMALLTILPAVLSELLMGRGPDEDKEEDWLTWAGKKSLMFALTGFVGVRDIVNAMGSDFGYAGSPVGSAAESMVRLGKQIAQGEADRGLARAAVDTAGPVLHLPSRQAWITAEGLYLWAEGREITPFEMFVTRDPKKFRD